MLNVFFKTFACVADSGSFNKAAPKLFISATAVRKQIDALESSLDMKLFVRGKSGVELTASGKSLRADYDFLAQASQRSVEKARKAMETVTPLLRVGSSLLNPSTPFMDLWQQASPKLPQYSLHIIPFDDRRDGILDEIERIGEKYDFLVAACGSSRWLERCRFQKMGEYRICCAMPQGHRLAGKKLLKPEDLEGECVMLGARGDASVVDQARSCLENVPHITLENVPCFYDIDVFNRCESAKKIMLTLECWQNVHPSLITIPVDWPFRIAFGLLHAANPSSEARNFLKIAFG